MDIHETRSSSDGKLILYHLLKQLIGSAIEDVSLKEKAGYDAIVGTLQRQLPTAVNWDEVSNLGTIGIDEIAMKKGHKGYAAVITARQDDGEVVILAVLEDRKKSVAAFLETIPPRLRTTIHIFCSDMWEGYIHAVNECSERYELEAHLVVDRFHVAKNYRDGFDDLRKKEMRRLKSELPAEIYQADFEGALWLLRHNHEKLDEDKRDQLRRMLAHSPQLHQAYSLRQCRPV